MLKRLKIKNCLLFLLVIGLMITAFSGLTKEAHAEESEEMQCIVVHYGDTLWDLVDSYCEYKGDIRAAIYEVRQINDLNDCQLTPGQVLYIPFSYADCKMK